MQDQQIFNSTITIEEVVDKGKKLVIKGNNGSRVFTYNLWKSKQDGSDSSSYAQFKTMGLNVGSTVMIGYVVDEYETEINGFPKKVQSKKIINFRETNAQPTQTPAPQKSFNGEAPTRSQGHSNDAYGTRLAIHGFVNAMIASGIDPKAIGPGELDVLLTLEGMIDNKLSATANPVANLEPELPTIQVEDDLSGDDIPF